MQLPMFALICIVNTIRKEILLEKQEQRRFAQIILPGSNRKTQTYSENQKLQLVSIRYFFYK